MPSANALPLERIERRILLIRGHKVLLDADLAVLYGVSTKRFNEQVRRNSARFPEDFMFRLSAEEWAVLRSQLATLERGRGRHRKYLPFVFTEHGAIMAATILNSSRATQVSVYVVRAFVHLREFLASHDQAIAGLVDTIQTLMAPAEPKRRPIGFVRPEEKKRS